LVLASIALGAVGTLLACESVKGMNAPAPGHRRRRSANEPLSSTSTGSKLTPQAVQVYNGDAAALKSTLPTIVGTIEACTRRCAAAPSTPKTHQKAEAPKPASSSAHSAARSGSAVRGRPPASI
jgi:hypothetical protein